ncbi:MAG TPA: hypothetical protein VHM90_20595 [Phycisphaerae bacterium]|nr:hypothetical protein [Phycisphaerae bacterium]
MDYQSRPKSFRDPFHFPFATASLLLAFATPVIFALVKSIARSSSSLPEWSLLGLLFLTPAVGLLCGVIGLIRGVRTRSVAELVCAFAGITWIGLFVAAVVFIRLPAQH